MCSKIDYREELVGPLEQVGVVQRASGLQEMELHELLLAAIQLESLLLDQSDQLKVQCAQAGKEILTPWNIVFNQA